jgi:4-amino-4-deoxy-L-arabinose transferase-like glycosyltransferase
MALQCLQVIVSAITSVMLYLAGRRFYGSSRAGIIAALVHAVYLPSIHFSVQKIWSTTLSGALLLLSLIVLDEFSKRPTVKRGAWVGAVLGFAALTNPLFLGVIPPQLAWLVLVWRKHGRVDFRPIGVSLLVLFLCVFPWTVRNWAVFGRLVPIKSNLGHELLLGNHPGATGLLPGEISGIERSVRGFTQPIPGITMTQGELDGLNALNEAQQNHEYLAMATDYMIAHPIRFLGLTIHRFVRFWSFHKSPKNLGELASYSEYVVFLLLAIVGWIQARRRGINAGLAAFSVLCFPIGYYITIVGLYRYRYPVEPILILFAALVIERMVDHLRSSSCAAQSLPQ